MNSLNNDNTFTILKAAIRLIASVVVAAVPMYVLLVARFFITK